MTTGCFFADNETKMNMFPQLNQVLLAMDDSKMKTVTGLLNLNKNLEKVLQSQ